MQADCSVRRLLIAILLAPTCWLFLQLLSTEAIAEPGASPPQMMADAQLNDITFIDSKHGWAVGDRGVIWHNENGGKNWHLQNSGVGGSLQSVCFIDSEVGWAVGGWVHPTTHKTTGVVLRTRDGGSHWVRELSPMIPALKRVKFFNSQNGWAVGNSSTMYPSGVFRTSDGGRNWIPITSHHRQAWLTWMR